MKQRWIAFLLACVIAMGAMGAFAVMADAAITEEPAAAGSADAGENAEAAAQQTDAAAITFDSLAKRVRENNYTALALGENIALLNEIDYKKLETQIRDGLSEIEDAQWALTSAGSVSDALAAYDASEIAAFAGTSNGADQVLAKAIDALSSGMAQSTNAQLQAQYDALDEQLDNIKSGKLQKDNEGVILQLKTAQNQMIMAAQTLYLTLLGLERSDAALTRSLAALDRTVNEMNLRYQMGQISALQLRQVTAGREQLVSGQKTLQMNMDLLRMQLCAMIGEDPGTKLALQSVEMIDADYVANMDLEGELKKSKEASYEIYAAKKTLEDAEKTYKDAEKEYGKNSKKMEFTQAKHTWQAAQYTYQAAMQSYDLKFRTQYAKVKDYAQILTAAQVSLDLEQAEYNVAALKYQQGTISANALKTAADELQEAKDSVATAQSDLYSNYITYQWAVVNGILN